MRPSSVSSGSEPLLPTHKLGYGCGCSITHQLIFLATYEVCALCLLTLLCHIYESSSSDALVLFIYVMLQTCVAFFLVWQAGKEEEMSLQEELSASESLELFLLQMLAVEFAGFIGSFLALFICDNMMARRKIFYMTICLVPFNALWPIIYVCTKYV